MTRFPRISGHAARWSLAAPIVAFVVALALTLSRNVGEVVSDTKLDLVVNPWGFLRRATNLWDPLADFGRIQNQAIGYLLPMGPFFGITHSLGAPPWLTQRLWFAVLLSAGWEGCRRALLALGIGTRASRVVAAITYAAGPTVL